MNALSRRRFLVLGTAAALRSSLFAREPRTTLFLGNGGASGILTAGWNPVTGELSQLTLAASCNQPGFLALSEDGRFLYAATDTKAPTGRLQSFQRQGDKLTPLNQIPSGGQNPCHIAVAKSGWALAANYNSGQWLATRILPNGTLAEGGTVESPIGHGPVADRQKSSHTHWSCLAPNGRFAYVNDLGSDRIWLHHLDAKRGWSVVADGSYVAKPGSGPRTLHFHPHLPIAYAVCELDATILVLGRNANTGHLRLLDTVQMLTEAERQLPTRGCDLVLTRDGRHAYAINRIDGNSLLSYRLAANGRLGFLASGNCGGKTPRHLALDPSERWLLIANQDSGNITVFPRNPLTGKLGALAHSIDTPTPMCLLFA